MTPEQKLKALVLAAIQDDEYRRDLLSDQVPGILDPIPVFGPEMDALYSAAQEADEDLVWEFQDELRVSGEDTDLVCDWSRYYESKGRAVQALDGSWVGFTYWYGGGKHGEPGSVEWMDDAYDVEVHEETRVIRIFSKKNHVKDSHD